MYIHPAFLPCRKRLLGLHVLPAPRTQKAKTKASAEAKPYYYVQHTSTATRLPLAFFHALFGENLTYEGRIIGGNTVNAEVYGRLDILPLVYGPAVDAHAVVTGLL